MGNIRLPDLVIIISVPSSLNLSQSSLFSRWHLTPANSSQLHLGLIASAYGLGPHEEEEPSLVDPVEGEGEGVFLSSVPDMGRPSSMFPG